MTLLQKKNSSPADIAKEYATRIWDKRDLPAIDILLAENVTIHSSLGDFKGRAKMKEVVSAYYTAFPDLTVVNDFTISEGDKTLIHWRASGTHLGVFKDVPPTGKKITYAGVTIYRTNQDQIIEYWAYLDLHHLLFQMS